MRKKNIQHNSSFRDRDGFIFESSGKLLRQVNKSYQEDYDLFKKSGLYQKLVDEKLLVPHKETDIKRALTDEAYRVLEPRKIDFISYPYEWCFSQLKEAALLTLKIQSLALEYGMSLKDASAFNIQFVEGKPLFIDTLSFEKFNSKPWVAYRQFCQHFLNPLILMSRVDLSLNRLLSLHLEGISAELTARLLPFRSRFSPTTFVHIQLPSKMAQKVKSGDQSDKLKERSFSKGAMLGLVSSLESAVSRIKLEDNKSFWSGYNPPVDSYTEASFKQKEKIVSNLLSQVKPKKVWDLGGNTGLFSRLAADKGAKVFSFDYDPLSVERNYQRSKDYPNVLPLVIDWTNPSGDLGWGLQERESIIERGGADCVMALALIHHLAIGANVPLEKVAQVFSKLGTYLIIEFVPKDDPQVKEMLSLREDIFSDYTRPGFEEAFGAYFKIIKEVPIKGSLRRMYLMKTK